MGDVIPIRRTERVEPDEQERRALFDPSYTQLLPLDRLAQLRRQIEDDEAPAGLQVAAKAVAVLAACLYMPGANFVPDSSIFLERMPEMFADQPAKALWAAIWEVRRTKNYIPPAATVLAICEELRKPQRQILRAIDAMEEEHHRRRKEAERQAEREAGREGARRLREEQAARIRALYGDAVAVSPEEIQLATYLRPIMRWPIGKIFAWHESLDRGELWAAKHCRRLALAERARRAELKGLISPGHAAAIARLAMVDEPAARSKLAEEIGEDPFAEQIVDLAPCSAEEGPDFNAAVMQLEAAAWKERGIFEGDLTLPGPLVQNERFGPVPAATLNFKEDPEKTAAALKRAKEVLELQR